MMSLDAYEVKRLIWSLLPNWAQRGTFARAPFVGYLDPLPRGNGQVRLQGWVFSPVGAIESLAARFGGREVPIAYGLLRPDVAARFPDQLRAATSGFCAQLDASAEAIEVWARYRSGRLACCFARRRAL